MRGFSYFALLAAVSAVSAVPTELVSRAEATSGQIDGINPCRNCSFKSSAVPAEATIGQIGGISPESAQVVLINACTNANFGGCISLNFATVPTGCIAVPAAVNNAISSAQAVTGIRCTLFDAANCSGTSVVIAGNIANLGTVGMNDLTSSVSCVSA